MKGTTVDGLRLIRALALAPMKPSTATGLVIFCIAFGFVISAWGMFGFWAYGYAQNDWERCAAQKSPEGAVEVLEAQIERTEFTYFPLGVECTWAMADGSSLSRILPEIGLTLEVYGGLALGVGGAVASVVRSARAYRQRV